MKHLGIFLNLDEIKNAIKSGKLVNPYVALMGNSGSRSIDYNTLKDYSKEYFTIKVISNITFTFGRRANELSKYRLNNGEWTESGNGGIQGLSLTAGDKIELSWAPTLNGNPNFYSQIFNISGGGQYEFSGNIFSLMYGDEFIGKTSFLDNTITFSSMFASLTGLVSVENLILPALTLNSPSNGYDAYGCYEMMFVGCTNLINAPELPATTLAGKCYKQMFSGCTNLTKAPKTIGTSETILANNCCEKMFYNCQSLITAPELPSMNLSQSCYMNMFGWCRKLVNAPVLPAMNLATSCYNEMFNYCEDLVVAPELPATTLADYCYNGMFSNCNSLISAPELPATNFVIGCYYEMFIYCTSLNYVKCLAKGVVDGYTSNWLYGVSSTGTFVKSPNMENWQTSSSNGIPNGWTVEDATE